MEKRQHLFRHSLHALQVLVTIVLLGLLLHSSSWTNVVEMWRQMNTWYLVATAGLIVLSNIGGAVALLVLFELKGCVAWWSRFTVDYFHVQALCQLTPAQAGEVALPYVAGRGRFVPGEIAASLVIQRMVALGIIVLVAILGAGRWVQPIVLWSAAAFVLLGCAAAVVMIRNSRLRSWLNDIVDRRFGSILYGFYDTWTSVFRDRRGRLVGHVFLMTVRFLVGALASYTILMAFSVSVPFWDLAALSALATLAALVPISINGIGVTEGIFVAALSGYGFATEQILAACLVGRALGIMTVLTGSAVYWYLRWRERRIAVIPLA